MMRSSVISQIGFHVHDRGSQETKAAPHRSCASCGRTLLLQQQQQHQRHGGKLIAPQRITQRSNQEHSVTPGTMLCAIKSIQTIGFFNAGYVVWLGGGIYACSYTEEVGVAFDFILGGFFCDNLPALTRYIYALCQNGLTQLQSTFRCSHIVSASWKVYNSYGFVSLLQILRLLKIYQCNGKLVLHEIKIMNNLSFYFQRKRFTRCKDGACYIFPQISALREYIVRSSNYY